MTDKKKFLTVDFPALITNLDPSTVPSFGLMTAQHAVEHLLGLIKMTTQRNGEPENPPTERQLGFKQFIENGAVMQYRPSNKTKADLPPLKYESYAEAATETSKAIQAFYDHFEANPDFLAYAFFMGELDFKSLELLHYMHIRHHLWQFRLIESYP